MPRRKSLIKIKKKPEKPTRFENIPLERVMINMFNKLDQVISYFHDRSENVKIEYDCVYGEDLEFVVYGQEPFQEYIERLERYEKELEKYNTWYERNKDLIEEELRLRKEAEKIELVEKKTMT